LDEAGVDRVYIEFLEGMQCGAYPVNKTGKIERQKGRESSPYTHFFQGLFSVFMKILTLKK
jgi:hypothetical protein